MKRTSVPAVITATVMAVIFTVLLVRPVACFSRETLPLPQKTLENAWSNLNLDKIDFKKAGLSEAKMKETLARVCAELSAHPQKARFLVREIHGYAEFRDLYMSSSDSVRRRVDVLLPQVLENIFMGKESVTEDISLADLTKGLATYLMNKKKMDAFAKLRYNETMMRRFAASIYRSMDTNDLALANALENLFVTVANKKKFKISKKAA